MQSFVTIVTGSVGPDGAQDSPHEAVVGFAGTRNVINVFIPRTEDLVRDRICVWMKKKNK